MIIDLNDYDLIKAITRKEAKAVHKELPPGGVWRTIKGHHVYIKDGKVLAGSIPGVTKAKKATKAHLAEHQATIDREAKKGTKENEKGKGENTSETKRPKTRRAGTSKKTTSKTGSKEKAKNSGSKQKGGEIDEKVPKKPKTSSKGVQRSTESKPDGGSKSKSTAKPKTPKSGSKATTKKAGKTTVAKEKADRTKAKVGAGKDGKTTKPTAKKTTPKSSGAGKSVSSRGKKSTSEGGTKSKSTTKKGRAEVKDVRSDAQKNRELAYDVGDKIGGARKDEFEASFKIKPTLENLAKLESVSPALAEKLVTKDNLLPKFTFEDAHSDGTELPTAITKKLLFDRIAPKPSDRTLEERKAYMNAMQKFTRHIAGIKSWDNMKNAIRELSEYARRTSTKNLASTASSVNYFTKQAETGKSPGGWDIKPEEREDSKKRAKEFSERLKTNLKDKEAFDFEALGEKFNNFFTDWDSRERTLKTVQKNTREGWEKYLTPQAKKAPKKKGGENKRWERKAEAEDLRTGGKKIKMDKPEQLVKEFNLRGVEFGHWVNDSSGKYHLQRSAEAFSDLADVLGIDPKDVSLNGRLAVAFGARGKGTALAHYEPDRKVINMTKHGGAGSLAHEWGHAMDNILYQYSHGGKESLGLGADDVNDMGDNDPKLKALYQNVMDTIMKPQPGDKGGMKTITLDSSAKTPSHYYPSMRRQVEEGKMTPEEIYHEWTHKIADKYDRYIASARTSVLRSPEDREKQAKKYEAQKKREINKIEHMLANEYKRKQGEDVKIEIKIPTGNSEYYQRMLETQPGKQGTNGAHYWSQGAEMFARVFESYVQDKLKKEGRYNNYLVHGTGEGNVKVEGAPFPLGKERQAMFKAMENLMKHVSSKGTLKKALILEILASGHGDMTEELRKSARIEELDSLWKETLAKDIARMKELGVDTTGLERKRSAYNVENPEEVIYIPLNRLKTVYQTDKATNWDKVRENLARMEAGENLEPISIGLDYDVHDGHHRLEASKLANYEHAPCIVKGGNEIERQQAIEAYKEVWKAIVTDPVAPDAFVSDSYYMYRGIGQKELLYIMKNKHVQSKGKGNDDDKDRQTCFSNLYRQAEGYARSNYDLYNEKQAYVIALPKRYVVEDEHGELIANQPVPIEGMKVIPIPKPQ